MASNSIYFENPHNGKITEAPVGFSWTTFFFGPLPMLFRGNWKWFAISFLLAIFTLGLSGLVLAFLINKIHIKDLVSDGYKVKSIKIGTIEQVSSAVGFNLPQL